MRLIRHSAFAQKTSCAAASAWPVAAITPMSRVRSSERRVTSYSGPRYAAYSARVVLCAVTQGVPAAS
jgi:hypothetical protein